MTSGGALYKGDTFDAGWGTFRLDEQSVLTLSGDGHLSSAALQLDHSGFVDVFVTDDWACLMGAADGQVVVAQRSCPQLTVVGEMTRVGSGAVTPVGTHAVRFHPLSGPARCLLTWEIGCAVIDPGEGVIWSHVHGDPDQRVLAITESTVELRGLRSTLSVDLNTGSAAARDLESPISVDVSTLAEWRRGIGR